MNLFLGDNVTLVLDLEPEATFVTGLISGIVLDKHKKVERVYIQGIDHAFWMTLGWKFVDDEEVVVEDD